MTALRHPEYSDCVRSSPGPPAHRSQRTRSISSLLGSPAGERLVGRPFEDDLILGFDGADFLLGLSGADYLFGEEGNDILRGGTGNDVLDGGAGFDTASYYDAAAAVEVDLAVTAEQDTGGAGIDRLRGVETLAGSAFDDTLRGNAFANQLRGNAGLDLLEGRAGDDVLLGGDGGDRLRGGQGDDILRGGSGNDALDGGAGFDLASYADATGPVTVDLATVVPQDSLSAGLDRIYHVEGVVGGASADTLRGNPNDNRIEGGPGRDLLDGRAGNDLLLGGAGDDRMYGRWGTDVLVGGAGNDVLDGGTSPLTEIDVRFFPIFVDLAADVASYDTATSAVTVDLRIQGSAQATIGGGTDTLVGIEALVGSAFDDTLYAGDQTESVNGGAGNDRIVSGTYGDLLVGGAGADTFAYETLLAATTLDFVADQEFYLSGDPYYFPGGDNYGDDRFHVADTIQDFDATQDRIDLTLLQLDPADVTVSEIVPGRIRITRQVVLFEYEGDNGAMVQFFSDDIQIDVTVVSGTFDRATDLLL